MVLCGCVCVGGGWGVHAYVWCTVRRCWQSISLSLSLSCVVLTSESRCRSIVVASWLGLFALYTAY